MLRASTSSSSAQNCPNSERRYSMRRLSTRRRRSATSLSRRDQSRSASSTAKSADGASSKSCCNLARGSAGRVDARDDVLGPGLLPGVEHLLEQRLAIVEVPVEAALGHPQAPRPAPRPARRPGLLPPAPAAPRRPMRRVESEPWPSAYLYGTVLTDASRSHRSIRHRMDRGDRMKLPNAAHESHPWRIREIAPDFTLEDVWALPVHGDAEDFQTLLELLVSDPAKPDRSRRACSGTSATASAAGSTSAGSRPRARAAPRAGCRSPDERNLTGRAPARRPARHGEADVHFGSLPFGPCTAPTTRSPPRSRTRPCTACAPGLGRPGRGPLRRADGRLRQAARPLRRATWR